MSETPTTPASTPEPAPPRPRWRIGEDWAATVTGLVLLGLALLGVIPAGLVP
ncbi:MULTISPECIES: hypothetical protein [Nocardiopsidaceae]|uniref:Uncharacterized protein n=2 Tax=Nocardiopsidaceae TaxID=83676 RepID=A0ABY6YHE8_9ACTN|nr:hypothetical protein [Streptomonospora nanhaiensis]MEE2046424.1 hypothetical protein [Nocardiopsis tropica]WAE71634.1 hypothetical protein OUQ99_20660 [Streptomonospora nanhaiensis]